MGQGFQELYDDFKSKFPLNKIEVLCTRYYDEQENLLFYVTTNQRLGEYYLYEVKDGKSKKIETMEQPLFKEIHDKKSH